MALSVLLFLANLGKSLLHGKVAGDNPWHAWTLEWATTSPPSPHNFESVPPIRSRRPLWDLSHPGSNAELTRDEAAGAPPDKSVVAVWAFIASETAFFVVLILSFVFFNSSTAAAARVLDLKTTGMFTACLLASSGTLHLAEKSHERGNAGAFRGWMVATLLLGAVFMAGQAHEYAGLFDAGLAVNSSLFTSTFFTLTGFHGLHVTLGLVALAILWKVGIARTGDTKGGVPTSTLKAVGLYWHFVDVVWIFVFSIVYVRSAL